jgi:circularly permuted ATPgrasp domain protein
MTSSSEAVRNYHALLESEPGLLEESREYLEEKFREVRLVFGGRALAPYLRPHFVTRAEWTAIKSACERVWGAIEKVGKAAPHDKLIFEQLALTDGERQLLSMSPGYDEISVTSRLDSFLTDQTYQFVELNAECPAGIAYQDVAAEIFLGLPVMRRFRQDHNVTAMYCRQNMLDALLRVYRRVRGAERPNIGIVDYKGQPTQREFELFKDFFEQAGYDTTIADPRDLDLRQGKLYHNDFPIDLVYRRVLTTELLEKIDECRALVEAYRTGAAVLVNSFQTKYVHKKMLFGVLTDERHQHYFSETEREAVGSHIPWTRWLADAKTTYGPREIELLSFVRQNRERLVLKPNDDYGGHGIYIGWEMDADAWDQAVESALGRDYLVQERVTTSRELFPYLGEDGVVQMIEQLLDLDPLLFFGRVAGAFTRLSSSSLANVTSGAGMVPTMVID